MTRQGLMRTPSRMRKRLRTAKARSTGARSLVCTVLARFSNPLWPLEFTRFLALATIRGCYAAFSFVGANRPGEGSVSRPRARSFLSLERIPST